MITPHHPAEDLGVSHAACGSAKREELTSKGVWVFLCSSKKFEFEQPDKLNTNLCVSELVNI
jgi:hypothetical protein